MLVGARARPTSPTGVQWAKADFIVPTGTLLLPAIGGLMVISVLVVSVMLIAIGYPGDDLSLWAAE